MDEKIREFLREIGRRGGLKRKLTSDQARKMVEAREAKKKRKGRKK